MKGPRESLLAHVDPATLQKDSLTFSPDGRHLAFVKRSGDKVRLVVDGREELKEYDFIRWIALSRDGKRYAYEAKAGGKVRVVIDGREEQSEYDSIQDLKFSPDGARIAYGARLGEEYVSVLDGREGKRYRGGSFQNQIRLHFSPDGSRFACTVWLSSMGLESSSTTSYVYVDGEEKRYADYTVRDFQFSPDGGRVAYLLTGSGDKRDQDFAVIDGVEGKRYSSLDEKSLLFSPVGGRVAYVALADGKHVVVVDGREEAWEGGIDAMKFSPDGRHLAYLVKTPGNAQYLVIDGNAGERYESTFDSVLVFSGDSRHVAYLAHQEGSYCAVMDAEMIGMAETIGGLTLSSDGSRAAFVALSNGKWYVVVDGKEGKRYDGAIGSLTFSPDGRHLAYLVEAGKTKLVVADGEEQEAFDAVVSTLLFGSDGNHLAYVARTGNQYCLVVSGKKEKPYDRFYRLSFDSPGKYHYLAMRQNDVYLVEPAASLEVNQGDATACYDRGNVKYQRFDYDGALADFSKAIDLKADYGEALRNRGMARHGKGDIQGAVDDYSRGLALSPNDALALGLRGNAYYDLYKMREALADYRRVCELEPADQDHARLRIWLVRAHLEQRDEATLELKRYMAERRTVEVDEGHRKIADFLCGALSVEKLLAEAESTDGTVAAGWKCEAWFYAGSVMFLEGKWGTGLKCFGKCKATGLRNSPEYRSAIKAMDIPI